MDPSVFFQFVGSGWPSLIGPVGENLAGFSSTPPDPSMLLRIDLRANTIRRDLHRQMALRRASSKKMMGQKAKSVRPRPRHKEIITVQPLKVGDEHGKPASPRGIEHIDPFDALEYSSPRYLLEEENRSHRKLPAHITRGKQIKGTNEALEGLEGTFMVLPLEPTSAN